MRPLLLLSPIAALAISGTAAAQVQNVPADTPAPVLLGKSHWGDPAVTVLGPEDCWDNGNSHVKQSRALFSDWSVSTRGMLDVEYPSMGMIDIAPVTEEPIHPAATDSQYAAYTNCYSGFSAIRLYDYATGTSNQISYTSTFDWESLPSIHGNLVVWQRDQVGSVGTQLDVELYDISLGGVPISIASSTKEESRPTVWNGNVAYQAESANGDFDLAIYNHTAGTTATYGSATYSEMLPHVWGGIVAYERYNLATMARTIAYRDLASPATEVVIPNITGCAKLHQPRVGGSSGEFVLFWGETCTGGTDRLFVFHRPTNSTYYVATFTNRPASAQPFPPTSPDFCETSGSPYSIYDDVIVFADRTATGVLQPYDIKLVDINDTCF